MSGTVVSEDYPFDSKFVEVHGSKMHYIESGSGTPILFLHGVPTFSYLWRNIIPHLSTLGRCIAPDLIGFGKSDKPDLDYSLQDHIKYINRFIEKLDLKNIILVLHGFGSIPGFSYAMHHENNCKGIVFYESFLRPIEDESFSLPFQEQMHLLNNNEVNIAEVSTDFVDKVMPQCVGRQLTNRELEFYRGPFLQPGSNKPLLSYLHELPNVSHQTNELISQYSSWLKESKLQKLMLFSIPGFYTTISTVMWAKQYLDNLEIIEIGESLHFAQETNPDFMGESISIWLQGIEQSDNF